MRISAKILVRIYFIRQFSAKIFLDRHREDLGHRTPRYTLVISRSLPHLGSYTLLAADNSIIRKGGRTMALNPEIRAKLQARIDELKKRMLYDANDLDYETHLNQVRELQKIIAAAK